MMTTDVELMRNCVMVLYVLTMTLFCTLLLLMLLFDGRLVIVVVVCVGVWCLVSSCMRVCAVCVFRNVLVL